MVTWILRSILVLLSVFAVKSTGNWIFQCRARVDNGSCIFWAGFAGYDASHAEFPLVVGRTGMLGILVGMDQKDRYAARCFTVAVLGHAGDMPVVVNNRCLGFYSAEKLWRSRSCRSFQVVDIPVVVQRPIPMVFLLGRPWRLRSCSIFPGGRCPCCPGRAWTCLLTRPSSSTTGAVVQTVVPQLQFSDSIVDFPCRGAEAYPHGPCEIPSCRTCDSRCPCCADAGALGPDSARHCLEVPQMQFCALGCRCVLAATIPAVAADSWRCLRFVHHHGVRGLRRGSFWGPAHQVQDRESCPQGHGPHNQVQLLACIDKNMRQVIRPHHHHHPPPPHPHPSLPPSTPPPPSLPSPPPSPTHPLWCGQTES